MKAIRIERGDTLVEVILSFAIFAVVAVSVSVLMNRGLAIGQQSLEVSLVREQINAQAEMLRFARYSSENQTTWNNATKADRLMSGENASKKPEDCGIVPLEGSFVIYPKENKLLLNAIGSTSYLSPATSSFVEESTGRSRGMQVKVARAENQSGDATATAYDFYIHACWYVPSADEPQTLTTMVRLYA